MRLTLLGKNRVANMNSRTIKWTLAIFAAMIAVAGFFTLSANSATQTQYPPVKQTFEAGATQTRAAALTAPTPRVGARPPMAITPVPTAAIPHQPAGAGWIVQDVAPPFPAMSHMITNMWYAEINGTRVLIYAGALRDNPGVSEEARQSVVIVVVQSLAGTVLPGGGTFRAPALAGPLHITDAVNERIILQSDSGAKFYFDVPTRAFVPSLN
jgi:hypothetical protein